MEERFSFILNGQSVEVCGPAAQQSLLDWLRSSGRTGSKEGCAEGDCGACSVLVLDRTAAGATTWRSINSCITLLPQVAGREVVTVEGLQNHPVQQAMVRQYGSQCGYCTPGFVASMTEAYYRKDIDTARWKINDQLCGNLCRCTGYRPIRDAMVEALQLRGAAEDVLEARLKAPCSAPGGVRYKGFYRPTTLDELLELLHANPTAALIAGSTEIGVDINKKFHTFPVLISTEAVEELRRIHATDDAWHVGGAATLSELEEALAGEFPAIDKMLWVFASRQIRNRATLAGNLITASPIGDMAPVLLALNASVVLRSVAGERTVPLDDFFVAYRKTVRQPDELLYSVIIPRQQGLVESFKVSKRRELDISIVAAAFHIMTDAAGVVQWARLAYGGVAATPVRARRTEAALVGRPWNLATATDVAAVLRDEFSPISDVRGSAEYRKGLIESLFLKFASGEKSEAQDELPTFDTSRRWEIPEESRNLSHDSAMGHVTGRSLYVDDQARQRDMLVVWPVCAPHAHARIVSVDTRNAERMPGVAAVITADDIPGMNDVGALRHDETLLARDEVMFHGHMVALVVGDSYEACRNAALKVEVEYEPLPAILTIADAVAAGSFHTDPHRIRRGDAQSAFEHCAHVLEGELESGGQEHFYLESMAAWAEVGDDEDVYIVSSTQHPSEIQTCVGHLLNLPRHKVVVQAPRMGGAFGGKETQGNTWGAVVALAAWKTRRPVRVQLDRDLDMQLTGKRHPFHTRFKFGFDEEGRIHALQAEVHSNGGWAVDLSESICDRALFHLDNVYYIPHVDVTGRVCKTHHVSFTAFRGFGGPQGMIVIEDIMDRIARHLGLPPHVVRERNLYHGSGETNTTHYGFDIGDNRIQALWHGIKQRARFEERRREVDEFNRQNTRIKRGLAITAVKFGISFTVAFLNQAGALVHIYRDGTVQVNHGGTEMGQGLYAKVQGIAMRELGLPASRVRVMKTSTDKVPNTGPTAASAGADLNGAAVRDACLKLKARLHPVAASLLGEGEYEYAGGQVRLGDKSVPFETLVDKAWFARVPLSATGYYATPGLTYNKATGLGRPFHYFAGGAAVSEVEVDGWSGMKKVRRVDILHDVGDSLNPGIDRGQIEGGFVQGMGWLTGEELLWDKTGRLLTHSASTYQIPAISDAPTEFNIELLSNAAQHNTVHGSKAVGEPPLMLALSVREALRDAVAAFGSPGGQVPLPAPATHEAIFLAVQQRVRSLEVV